MRVIDARPLKRSLPGDAPLSGYSQIRFRGVYPGVDIAYESDSRSLGYAFVVANGHSHSIRLHFARSDSIRLVSGSLALTIPNNNLRWQAPPLVFGRKTTVVG
jgi:hypothetical protein